EILEIHGYAVRLTPNGLTGVKEAIQNPPDLILCDVMMPALDGYGVLNLLQENERTASVPFVFITARSEKEDLRRGMNLGADDYITKPFYLDELIRVIETRLEKAAKILEHTIPAHESILHLSDPARGHQHLEEAFNEDGRERLFDEGQTIVREGEFPHFIYRVNEGNVHLVRSHEYGRDYIVAELGSGEIFGISTFLEEIPFHYSAKVASHGAKCQLLPRESLLKLLNTDRTVTEALMRLLASRMMKNSDRLVNQAYDSVRRRTALILCDLWEKYAERPVELSRDELAQMVGATKESVIRALSDFKQEGFIKVEGRLIYLLVPDALRGALI
ncbi:MAG: response regulator, partial [Bacteroidota bacterium]